MPARDFRDLIAWQKAMEFVVLVYKYSRSFLNEERFGLTRQLRESSVSIPSNIAEGQGRGSKIEFGRLLKIALGSRNEAIAQILVARELNHLPEPQTNCSRKPKKSADSLTASSTLYPPTTND